MRRILIQKQVRGILPTLVTFETGATPDQIFALENNTFDLIPSPFYPSPVKMLYDSLILGRPMPDTLLMNHTRHYGNVMACFLFLHQGDLFNPLLVNMVDAVDRAERFGSLGFVGLDRQLSILFQAINSFIPSEEHEAALSETDLGNIVGSVVDIIHHGIAVPFPNAAPILWSNTVGGCVADITSLSDIDGLFRSGFLYGAGLLQDAVVLFRRSGFIEVPLEKLANKLGGTIERVDNFLIIHPNVERNLIVSLLAAFFEG